MTDVCIIKSLQNQRPNNGTAYSQIYTRMRDPLCDPDREKTANSAALDKGQRVYVETVSNYLLSTRKEKKWEEGEKHCVVYQYYYL